MTKIMLVEDDKSLREIYGVRLLAEGYDIVSAGDGEEALAMAIKERPKLIVSDVMMPKISGFDMLDILRSTTETRDIKVIMMTALSSDDQRSRGQALGADRYLVKSQVGIEDVVRVVHEVLGDQLAAPQPVATPAAVPPPAYVPASAQVPGRGIAPQPHAAPPAYQPAYQQPAQPPQQPALQQPAAAPLYTAAQPPQPVQQPIHRQPTSPTPRKVSGSSSNRIIQPLSHSGVAPVDINELLDKELAREAGVDLENRPAVITVDQERALVNSQIQQFQSAPPPPPPASPGPQQGQFNDEPPAAPQVQPPAPLG